MGKKKSTLTKQQIVQTLKGISVTRESVFTEKM